MKWKWLPYAELTSKEVYDVLQLRERVFHLEKKMIFHDVDGQDFSARHLLGYYNEKLVCYLRVCLQNDILVIGRIAVDYMHRRQGLGKMMVKNTLSNLREQYPGFPISLSSQLDHVAFYAALGFSREGLPFDRAGLATVNMVMA